ncbi:rCG45444, partial [Rattus norvegicus]
MGTPHSLPRWLLRYPSCALSQTYCPSQPLALGCLCVFRLSMGHKGVPLGCTAPFC